MQESSAPPAWRGDQDHDRHQAAGRATGDPIPEPPFNRARTVAASGLGSTEAARRRDGGGWDFNAKAQGR